ncbi:hypothetical protein KGI22_13485, partial [Lactiplantibacillus pentosus]|uniref:hypothetical protein n=1 Tax=Lactiplantibacillus pentosus TaxID=1589 RepID=UPI001C1FE549
PIKKLIITIKEGCSMLGIHGLGPIRMFHLTEHIAGPRAAVGILLIIILLAVVYRYYRRHR